jgi:glycosyltransferase involved in cell wall biosynthesis
MIDVLVVTNEPVHPVVNGGRVRMAGIIEALSTSFEVDVLEPGHLRRSVTQTFRVAPRRGTSVLDPAAVTRAAAHAHVVLYTHSYLEPVGPRLAIPVVVDFQNLEVERQRQLASSGRLTRRVSSRAEAIKAKWWEPRTARRAAVAVAVTDDEGAVLRRWGAADVVVVPNASTAFASTPSPPAGPVTFLASATYEPNAVAGRHLLDEVWPLVQRRMPEARLRIAGRGTAACFAGAAGVEVLGEVDDVAPVFQEASMVVAPVTGGGGTQLKVIEALAHGRVVVASMYSAASAPPGATAGCVATDGPVEMADAIVALLGDVEARHRREESLRGAVPTWSEATLPLIAAVQRLLR